MTLGETIKYYRTQLNLSQTELGDRIGVSRQAVTKWEKRRSKIKGNKRFLERRCIKIHCIKSNTR